MASLARPVEVVPSGPPQGEELADVLSFPSQDERGFSYSDLAADASRHLVQGLKSVVGHARDAAFNVVHSPGADAPKVVWVREGKYEHMFLVKEPHPTTFVDPQTAVNEVLHYGLSVLGDVGSALEYLDATGKIRPGRRLIINTTIGMTHGGKDIPLDEAPNRPVEQQAAETVATLPHITRDGETVMTGESFGTFLLASVIEQNAAAANHKQLSIKVVKFFAPAAVACDVDPEHDFREAGLDEEQFRQELTAAFKNHLPGDALRMIRKNPLGALACAPVIPAYLLFPERFPSRREIIKTDFRSVQQGVKWNVLRLIAREHGLLVLAGEHDPLTHAQKPQYNKLAELHPGRVQQRILRGRGHLLSMDSPHTAKHMAEMEDLHDAAIQALAA